MYGLEGNSPTLNQAEKSLTGVCSISGLWFIPDVVKLATMNSHHRKERRGEGRGANGRRRGEERKVPGTSAGLLWELNEVEQLEAALSAWACSENGLPGHLHLRGLTPCCHLAFRTS